MKRIGLFLLAVVMVAGLAGCTDSDDDSAVDTCALADFVGTWKGNISGSVGSDTVTLPWMLILADAGGKLSGEWISKNNGRGDAQAVVAGCGAVFTLQSPGCSSGWSPTSAMTLTAAPNTAEWVMSGNLCGLVTTLTGTLTKSP